MPERIVHRFAKDPISLGADHNQIAASDRCRLRMAGIDTDRRQHCAAFLGLRYPVGRPADDAESMTTSDQPQAVR
jgi:hypothetical protein